MKILTHIEMPDLERDITTAYPGIKIEYLKSDFVTNCRIDGEILITIANRKTGLENILRSENALRWIHLFGTGVDCLPLNLIGEKILTNSKGTSSDAIAEWVFAMLLSAAKNLPASWIKDVPDKTYNRNMQLLKKTTLAIAGYGTIGQSIAKRALAFDMKVQVLTRQPRNTLQGPIVHTSNWKDLVTDADHLVLALPLTPDTNKILNYQTMSMLKDGVHLINVARGGFN